MMSFVSSLNLFSFSSGGSDCLFSSVASTLTLSSSLRKEAGIGCSSSFVFVPVACPAEEMGRREKGMGHVYHETWVRCQQTLN